MRADKKTKTILPLSCFVSLLIFASLAMAGSGENSGNNIETILLGDCRVGNLNPPSGELVPDIFMGDETYAYHIFPSTLCTSNLDGYILESISQLLDFNTDQIPAAFSVQPILLSANFDSGTDCWIPGPPLYEGPTQTFSINEPGIVPVQVFTTDVPAFVMSDHYFLAMRYTGGAQAQLVVDDDPQPCTEFINRGNGWEDLFGQKRSGGGKVIVFGDIIFSPASIGNTTTTWDGIKSLYK